jgi:nucleoid-associated protein YgaU
MTPVARRAAAELRERANVRVGTGRTPVVVRRQAGTVTVTPRQVATSAAPGVSGSVAATHVHARTVVVRGRRARAGDAVHVVVAGESLWSIAGDVLGGRATVAGVAREVNRLWTLNRERIGTGDRDLLPVGTRLELR